jgi:pseudaminic acid cytidylyltransferase
MILLVQKILAGDQIALAPVIEYVVEKYRKQKKYFDQVWLIYATNPFINEIIIKNCDKKFKKIFHSPNNALMTVSKFNKPVQWAQKINNKGYLEPISKKKLKIRSQDLTEYYCDAGMINIFSGKRFYNKISNIKFHPYKIDYGESFDIDTQEDFNLATKFFKFKKFKY